MTDVADYAPVELTAAVLPEPDLGLNNAEAAQPARRVKRAPRRFTPIERNFSKDGLIKTASRPNSNGTAAHVVDTSELQYVMQLADAVSDHEYAHTPLNRWNALNRLGFGGFFASRKTAAALTGSVPYRFPTSTEYGSLKRKFGGKGDLCI
jgi:hypothetical protein